MKAQNLITRILFFIVVLASAGCTDDEITPREYPRLETLEVTNISNSGATFNAKIILPGNQKIIEYGFVWGGTYGFPNKDPTLSSNRIFLTEGITEGDFSANITTTLYENGIYSVKAFAKTEEYTVYGKNIEFKSLGSKAAIFDDFSPKIGVWGDTINIKGKNFSYLPEYNQIFFKNLRSKVISSTDSTIICIVPENISDKKVPIFLLIAGQKSNSNELFELALPKIESFSPLKGTFNDTIKLIGENFNPISYKNIVSFNGHQASVLSSTENKVIVVVPTTIDKQLNEVKIITNLQSSIANDLFEILPPIIYNISPKSDYTNSIIKITGDNFNPFKEKDTVIIGSNIATIIDATKKTLTVKIPQGIYSSRSIKIEVRVASQTAYSTSEFTLKDPWIRKNNIPFEKFPRYYATGFSLLGKGYVGLGLGNSFEDANHDFYRYHPVQNTWKKITDFGGGGRYDATSFVIGNYAYIGAGRISSQGMDKTNDFWRFDPQSETWTEIANLPVYTARAVGLSVNGFGYLCTSDETDNFWKYDPIANQWTQLPDLIMPQEGAIGKADSGFAIGDNIYIYVSGNSTGLHHLYEFNTNTLQWTRKADMIDSGIRIGVIGFSIKEKGYIIDAYNIHEYNPVNDTWNIKESTPRSRQNAIEFVIDDKAYFGSGSTGGSSASDFWEYDIEYE